MILDRIAPIAAAPLRWAELTDPEPAEGEIRVRVRVAAICRTDLHVIEGDLPRRKLPIVPGHQVVGVVDKLGPGCRHFALGERVGIAWLRHTCGCCRFCTCQRENLCPDSLFTGYDADGGYAELAVVPEEFAYAIPADLTDGDAVPLLCAGIIGYRALARAQLPPGGKLALYGFGSSAHVVAQLARHRGAEIYVVTRGSEHRALAAELGAVWVGGQPAELPVRVDSAIVFAPAGELVPAALERLERGGTLSLAGIYMTPIPQLDYQRHVFYERDVRTVTSNTRADGRALLSEAAAIGIKPRVATYPLADANRALADLKHDRIRGTGVLAVEES